MAKKGLEEKATEKEVALFNKNYATDQQKCGQFLEFLRDRPTVCRQTRLDLEQRWLEDLRSWSCMLDYEGYQGRSNIFVPELNNQVESSVERAIEALFPTSDYIQCIPMKSIDDKQRDKIKAAVQYELEVKNQLSSKHWDFERAKVLFGNGIYRVGFERNFLEIFRRDAKGKPIKDYIPKWNGVKVDVVDNFRFYTYPEVCSLEDAQIIFEDRIYHKDQMIRDGIYVNLDQVTEITYDIDHQWVDATRLELMRLSNVLVYYRDSVLLTEVYCDFELTKGNVVPVKATIANNRTVIRLVRNPFWFQSAPYLTDTYNTRPGQPFYGLSLADKIRTQQYAMNDLANQTMDSLNYSLNPISIIDPGLAGDVTSMKVMPGARWLGSPEGIQFANFPDVSGSGLRAMQEIRGQIAQFADNTPGIAPQLQGKARSATQASIVQQAVSTRQKVSGRKEESNVLNKLCKMTHILLQQFQTDAWQIRVQGPDKGSWITQTVQPADLVGDVDWVWRGVSEKEQTAVRSQQLLAFYNLALQTNALMPGEVDLPELFKLVAKDAFDIRDIDYIFQSLKQKKSVDPELENIALEQAKEVDINPGDDDELHMQLHGALLEGNDLTDEARLVIVRHNEAHQVQLQGKKQLAQMKARVEALQAVQGMQGGPGGGSGDGRTGPAVPSPMEGNQGQVASSPEGVFSGVNTLNMG